MCYKNIFFFLNIRSKTYLNNNKRRVYYLNVFSFSVITRVTLAISKTVFGISRRAFVRVTLAVCSFIPLSLPENKKEHYLFSRTIWQNARE